VLLPVAALVPLATAPTGFSPTAALGLIALVGLGLGPTFPFTVVVVQNAVALHQLGVATGTMNFFRALGSTFIVSAFGAIVLAGAPGVLGMSAGAVVRGGGAAGSRRGRGLSMGLRRRHSLPRGRALLHSRARGAGAARPLAAGDGGGMTRWHAGCCAASANLAALPAAQSARAAMSYLLCA